ncbi:thiosulfate oxidation carrier protein SoxY [Hylemonella sp. W303a]|uniref:thiosulfate oxidation carrier protein SoxY n=1 Tax=Hylemonella sp. W303a TaxID=3389873 RepID=UPI00396AF6E5
MIEHRRSLFKTLASAGMFMGAWNGHAIRTFTALGLLGQASALLAQTIPLPSTNRSQAFKAQTPGDALRLIVGNASVTEVGESQIQLQVPELAENGAMVPVTVSSRIPDTRQIMLLIDKNPYPLVASFYFPEGTEPSFQTRVKMAESSRVRVLVSASLGKDSRYFTTSKDTRVTLGGCGS